MKNRFMFLLLLMVFSFLFLSCSSSSNFTSCCQECLAQAEHDPSGYDISIKPCGEYELSEGCEKYFEKENKLVGECRKDNGGY